MFGHDSLPSKVFSYGARVVENEVGIIDQIGIAHRYQNSLVEIEWNRREAVYARLNEMFPAVSEHESKLNSIKEAIDLAEQEIRRANATSRKRTATKEQREHLKGLRDSRKSAYLALKQSRAEAFGSLEWKVAQKLIDDQANASIRELRATAGLYWCTYLDVETRVKRSGHPPCFRRWNGEGKLSVQLQKGRSWEQLAAGTDNQIRVVHDGGRHATLQFRIGSSGRSPIFATLRVTLHRPIAANASIKWVHLTRRVIAHHAKYHVQFVVSAAGGFAKDCAAGGSIGINVGWRTRPNGIRVAYWFGDDGSEGELIVPTEQLRLLQYAEYRQSESDSRFNVARERLAKWLDSRSDMPEWLREKTEHLRQWRSPGRLYAVAKQWRDNRFDGDETIFHATNEWAGWSRKNFDAIRGMQTRFLRFRKDLYRNFAAKLAKEYQTVALAQMRLTDFACSPDPDDNESVTLNNNRRNAAISELVESLKNRFAESVTVSAVNITRDCHACGNATDFDRIAQIEATCDRCGAEWDQDANAARNIIARAATVNAN